jgi:hypothetical protein
MCLGFKQYVEAEDPDLLVLTETKVSRESPFSTGSDLKAGQQRTSRSRADRTVPLAVLEHFRQEVIW